MVISSSGIVWQHSTNPASLAARCLPKPICLLHCKHAPPVRDLLGENAALLFDLPHASSMSLVAHIGAHVGASIERYLVAAIAGRGGRYKGGEAGIGTAA